MPEEKAATARTVIETLLQRKRCYGRRGGCRMLREPRSPWRRSPWAWTRRLPSQYPIEGLDKASNIAALREGGVGAEFLREV